MISFKLNTDYIRGNELTHLEKFKFLFITFLLMFISGNPIFIYSNNLQRLYVLLFIGILLLYVYLRCPKYNIVIPFISLFIVIMFVQVIIDLSPVNTVLFYVIKITIGVFLISIIGNNFTNMYFKLIYILSIISIIGFMYNRFFGIFPGIPMTDISQSLILYNQVGFLDRNSGMYWEPGAWQGYINLSLLLVMNNPNFIKKNVFPILIIIISLILTFSTTGYIVFFSIVLFYLLNNTKRIISKVFFLFVFILISGYIFTQSSFLNDKIEDEVKYMYISGSSNNAGTRFSDIAKYQNIIKEHAFSGIILSSDKSYQMGGVSNGFILQIMSWGIFGVLIYYFVLYKNFRKKSSRVYSIYSVFVVFLLMQGEGFLFHPLFWGVPLIELSRNRSIQRM